MPGVLPPGEAIRVVASGDRRGSRRSPTSAARLRGRGAQRAHRHGEIDLIAFDGRTSSSPRSRRAARPVARRACGRQPPAAGLPAPAQRSRLRDSRAPGSASRPRATQRAHDPLRRDRRDSWTRQARWPPRALEGGVAEPARCGARAARARAAGRPATERTCGAAARRLGAGSPRGAGRRVADVLGKAPARMQRVGVVHVAVARHLGHDRRGRDRGAGGIAVHDRALGSLERRHRETVDQADHLAGESRW